MMNSQRGIVFKTTAKYSIFLTPDGQFKKGIPNSNRVQVGEEISFQPYQKVKTRFISFNPAWSAPIIAVAATLVLLFSVLLPAQSSVSAFVQVDINPSVELGINQKGKVYVFNGLNEEGRTIKRDIAFWKGKPLSWVLLNIVNRTETILDETESIEITTIYQEEEDHDALAKVIENAVASSTSKVLGTKQEVRVLEASLEERDAARTEGLSVRKYHAELEVKKEKKERPAKSKDKVVPPMTKNQQKKQEKPPVQKTEGSEQKEIKPKNQLPQTKQNHQKSQPKLEPKVEPSQKNKDHRTKENSKPKTKQKDSPIDKNSQKRDTQKIQEKKHPNSSNSSHTTAPKANNDYHQKYKKNDEKNTNRQDKENKKDNQKTQGQGNHQSQTKGNGHDGDKGNDRNHKKSNDNDRN